MQIDLREKISLDPYLKLLLGLFISLLANCSQMQLTPQIFI